jgi:hypothetical protein
MRLWWLAAGGLVLAGLVGWWVFLRGPAPPETGVLWLVPEGGVTLADVNERFAVTLPAGWRWTVRTGRGGALWVNAARGDGPSERLNETHSGKLAPGEASCSISAYEDPAATKAAVDDAADRLARETRRREAAMDRAGDTPPPMSWLVRRLSRAGMAEVNGVAVARVYWAEDPKDGVVIVQASAFATHDGAFLRADCLTAVDAADPYLESAPQIAEIDAVVESFTPR